MTSFKNLGFALLAVFALCSSASVAGAAPPGAVRCGDTIRADTTLRRDLRNCRSNGLVIGADGVTLNLNGHTISGDGRLFRACPRDEACDVGVYNDGHDGLVVRNGSVREFALGLFAGRARRNRVLGISSSRNLFFGFVFIESARSVIRNSSGNANLAPEGDGIGLFASHHIRVLHNVFRRNAQIGIHVEDSNDNLIQRNVFARNSDFAVLLEGDRNEVRRNRCIRNETCVIVAPGNRNVIARNQVFRGLGGIAVEKGSRNLVVGNVVAHPRHVGILIGLEDPRIGGVANVARGNLVRGSGRDAFSVAGLGRRSLLQGNIAISAGDDGFDVRNRSARLAGNRALRNRDLGIQAIRGVTDAGGNVARGNGDARQCTHVACRPLR